jgi:hypothetical protein
MPQNKVQWNCNRPTDLNLKEVKKWLIELLGGLEVDEFNFLKPGTAFGFTVRGKVKSVFRCHVMKWYSGRGT